MNQQNQPHTPVEIPYAPVYQDRVERGKIEDPEFNKAEFNAKFGAPALKDFLGQSLQEATMRNEERKNPSEISIQLGSELTDKFDEERAKEIRAEQEDRVSGRSGQLLGISNAPSHHQPIGGPKVIVK